MRAPLIIPAAWTKADLLASKCFKYFLTEQNILELESALKACEGIPPTDIERADFCIPGLSARIQEVFLPQLKTGLGVLVLKGLNAENYSIEVLSKIHCILGLSFGNFQLQYGHLLLKVEDKGYQFGDKNARNTNTSQKLWFHNDSCDVVALMCVREAKKGGETRVVSAVAVHNALLEMDPSLVEVLYKPFNRVYRYISKSSDQDELYARPIFDNEASVFSCDYSRPTINRAQKIEGVPRLTPLQVEALNAFDKLCQNENLCHEFFLDPGDIIYMNNHLLLHARKSFEDHDEEYKKRLLMRLHISINSKGGVAYV